MNRIEATKLAETVTSEQLVQMLLNAQNNIKNWNVVSRVNKGFSKGVAFNIFTSYQIKVDGSTTSKMAITNMIWEFGEYLPGYTKPIAKESKSGGFAHQEPKPYTPILK